MDDRPGQVFEIAGRKFWLYELVWGQIRWLYQSLKAYPLHALNAEQVATLLSNELTKILAVILVPDGQTQAQKVEAGLSAVKELEVWLDGNMHPSEAAPVIQRFFDPAQLQKLAEELGSLMAVPSATGSSTVSSPSLTAT